MNTVTTSYADKLFSVLSNKSTLRESIAQTAVSNGTRYYSEGKYDVAIREFKRAASVSPASETALKAYNCLAAACIKAGDNEGAVKAYKSAIGLSPNQEDLHVGLGNVYFDQGQTNLAIEEYKKAVRLNPNSTTNLYSLGQAYLSADLLDEAMTQFEKIMRLAPNEYGGYYGAGQTYYKAGKYDEAIEQFNQVLDIKDDFSYARMDLGHALADSGRVEEAYSQAEMLGETDLSLSLELKSYINKVASPEFMIAYSTSGFNPKLGPGTRLTSLNAGLSSPNSSQEFTMKFVFNKEMDIGSVENPYNWMITRASGETGVGRYNWGMPVPTTEVALPLFPENVHYDSLSQTATVTFAVTQNSSGNGTLDASHIVFRFYGKDSYGNKMSPSADQYSGISKIV